MRNSVEVYPVQGSDYECGVQAGRYCQDILHDLLKITQQYLPRDIQWQDVQNRAQKFLPPSVQHYPFLINQLEGIAVGSGISFTDIFTLSVEEVLDSDPNKCTDVVFSIPYPIIAHNNDAGPDYEPHIRAIKWNTDRGTVLTIGLGPFMSVGVGIRPNGFALALSGNELYQNDSKKVGIPRSIIALAALDATNLNDAAITATHLFRASAYNLIIADKNHVLCIEGSATDYRLIFPDKCGCLIHTNHYYHPEMVKFEDDPNPNNSKSRLQRARQLLQDISNSKPIIPQLKQVLRDHGPANTPSNDTICVHDGPDPSQYTTFSTVTNMESGTIELAVGPPCTNEYHTIWEFGK